MIAFNPYAAIAGGLAVGLGAALLMLLIGRIAGVSGVLGALLLPPRAEWGWRAAFVLGLLAAPTLYALFAALPAPGIEASTGRLVAAGLLVGAGTRLGSGCTSGHGVCGLARGSKRSLAAVCLFMGVGMLTATVAGALT